jgi:hypothetical protein
MSRGVLRDAQRSLVKYGVTQPSQLQLPRSPNDQTQSVVAQASPSLTHTSGVHLQ